jgi:uncharacterized protein
VIYLDTSVLVAALTNEARTGEIQEWLAGREAGELVISDWVITEFSSALALKLRSGQVESRHRADALAAFNSLVESSLRILPVVRRDYQTAARFADQYTTGLRAPDALHLAVASHHGARLHSLDKLLIEAAWSLGVSAELL